MNDMSRPQSASRLSEDIGDVLSAIRRLIAEDEALDYARDTLKRQHPGIEPVERPVAPRFGGAAALARQMVRDSMAIRESRTPGADADIPPFAEPPVASSRPRLVADAPVPPSRGAYVGLVARRDIPLRRETGPSADPRNLAPLRLSDADRVAPSQAGPSFDEILSALDWSASPLETPTSLKPEARPQIAIGTDGDDDADDFAEAFDAKARMRPDILTVAAAPVRPMTCQDLSGPEADAMAQLEADASAFWASYGHSRAAAAEGGFDGIVAALAARETETLGGAEPEPEPEPETGTGTGTEAQPGGDRPAPFAMTIPAYLSGPVAEDELARDDLCQDDLTETKACSEEIPDGAMDAVMDAATCAPASGIGTDDLSAQINPAPADVAEIGMAGAEVAHGPNPAELAPVQIPVVDTAAADPGVTDTAAADEATVREVIREIIQEELHGDLGQRFSRNLRAVIRREVAAAIDEHLERF